MYLYIQLPVGTVCVKFDNANKVVSAAQSAVYNMYFAVAYTSLYSLVFIYSLIYSAF